MLCLEDIDAVGVDRSHNLKESTRKTLTFSGLLNTLDGVASHEGRILIMTTNYINKLDNALIRPGRIDMRIDFTLANKTMAAKLFEFLFAPIYGTRQECAEVPCNAKVAIEHADANQKCDESVTVAALAEMFATVIPDSTFSTAELMSYLLQYRTLPISAIEKAGDWVEMKLREKEDLKISLDPTMAQSKATSGQKDCVSMKELHQKAAKCLNAYPRT